MTPRLTRSRLYLFPSSPETQLTLGVVVRVLSPIGTGLVQPAIMMIRSFLGYTDTLIIHPRRRFSITARIWRLPAMNILVPVDFPMICFRESRILAQFTPGHLSHVSVHLNLGFRDVMDCSISTSGSRSAFRPLVFLRS